MSDFGAQFAHAKEQRNRRLIEFLHGKPDEPAAVPDDSAPNFDGGAREPAPGPTNPAADHDELVLELFRNAPSGGGGQW